MDTQAKKPLVIGFIGLKGIIPELMKEIKNRKESVGRPAYVDLSVMQKLLKYDINLVYGSQDFLHGLSFSLPDGVGMHTIEVSDEHVTSQPFIFAGKPIGNNVDVGQMAEEFFSIIEKKGWWKSF